MPARVHSRGPAPEELNVCRDRWSSTRAPAERNVSASKLAFTNAAFASTFCPSGAGEEFPVEYYKHAAPLGQASIVGIQNVQAPKCSTPRSAGEFLLLAQLITCFGELLLVLR
jgi:hypothetical protein